MFSFFQASKKIVLFALIAILTVSAKDYSALNSNLLTTNYNNDIVMVVINKTTSDKKLKGIKTMLNAYNVTMTLTDLKRNSEDVITDITAKFSSKEHTATYSTNNTKGITSFYFKMNTDYFGVGLYNKEKYTIKKDSIGFKKTIKFTSTDNSDKPLIIIDGNISSYDALKAINPDDIESVNVFKDKAALKEFGDAGKNGVIKVVLKNK